MVCRTGYTGERGYELVAAERGGTPALGRADDGGGGARGRSPCGLGARDTLRTEMGYPLHGQDISLEVTPGAGAGSAGRSAGTSRRSGERRRCCAEKEAGVAGDPARPGRAGTRDRRVRSMRSGCAADLPVGHVTSGTFSPTLRKGVALALLISQVQVGDEVLRRRTRPCRGLRRHAATVRRDRRDASPEPRHPTRGSPMTNTPEPARHLRPPVGPGALDVARSTPTAA